MRVSALGSSHCGAYRVRYTHLPAYGVVLSERWELASRGTDAGKLAQEEVHSRASALFYTLRQNRGEGKKNWCSLKKALVYMTL